MSPSEDYLRVRLDVRTRQRLDALVAREETTRTEVVKRAIRELAARKKVTAAELAAVDQATALEK
jgi:predicted transcriptional regulator